MKASSSGSTSCALHSDTHTCQCAISVTVPWLRDSNSRHLHTSPVVLFCTPRMKKPGRLCTSLRLKLCCAYHTYTAHPPVAWQTSVLQRTHVLATDTSSTVYKVCRPSPVETNECSSLFCTPISVHLLMSCNAHLSLLRRLHMMSTGRATMQPKRAV
jgi:hypothetical protein